MQPAYNQTQMKADMGVCKARLLSALMGGLAVPADQVSGVEEGEAFHLSLYC